MCICLHIQSPIQISIYMAILGSSPLEFHLKPFFLSYWECLGEGQSAELRCCGATGRQEGTGGHRLGPGRTMMYRWRFP